MTTDEAVQAINTAVKAVWDATGYDLMWPNVGSGLPPADASNTPAPWARLRYLHFSGTQALSAPPRLYERRVRLTAEVRVPIGTGTKAAYDLATIIRNGLEGTNLPDSLWARGARIQEGGPDDGWFLVNVIVDFVYDERH